MLLLRWRRSVPEQRACVCQGQHLGQACALYCLRALARHVLKNQKQSYSVSTCPELPAMAFSEQCVEVYALLSIETASVKWPLQNTLHGLMCRTCFWSRVARFLHSLLKTRCLDCWLAG